MVKWMLKTVPKKVVVNNSFHLNWILITEFFFHKSDKKNLRFLGHFSGPYYANFWFFSAQSQKWNFFNLFAYCPLSISLSVALSSSVIPPFSRLNGPHDMWKRLQFFICLFLWQNTICFYCWCCFLYIPIASISQKFAFE